MHISAVEEYGLRCALQLAQLQSLPESPLLAASQVAEREGLSVQYASKILHLFRKAGLVSASRGMQGGFRLARPADQTTIQSVFRAVREEKDTGFCSQFKGQQSECVHLKECSVRPVFHVLAGYFDSVLGHLTLADLARTEAETRTRVEAFAKSEAERLRQRLSVPASAGAAVPNRFQTGSKE